MPQRSNVNGVVNVINPSIFLEYIILQTKNLSFATIIDQENHKIKQIYIWIPMTTGFIM